MSSSSFVTLDILRGDLSLREGVRGAEVREEGEDREPSLGSAYIGPVASGPCTVGRCGR